MENKKLDWIILFLIGVGSVIITLYFEMRFLTTAFIFLGLPALYLILRKTQNLSSVFPGVVFIGIILGFIFDFLATFNNAWIVPDNQLVFPHRVLGHAPIDELIFLVLWVLLILLVYEHFFERKRIEHVHIHHYLTVGIFPALGVLSIVLTAFSFSPKIITLPYAYAVLGIISAIPLIYVGIKKKKLLKKIAHVLPYFFFLFLAFELTAISLGQWQFNGEYIGSVNIFALSFPLEELFIWIVASSVIVVADYKLFVDVD